MYIYMYIYIYIYIYMYIYITHRYGYRYKKFCKILQLEYGRIHTKLFSEISK